LRSLVAALAFAVATGAGCASLADPARPACALTLIALPAGVLISEDDPIPAGSQILAAPGDFDSEATTIEDDATTGLPSVTLRLRDEAAARLAAHSTAHIGDLIAISINGDVVAVPMIMAAIEDGEVSINPSSHQADAFLGRFEGCVR
jgi:SecD-like export protein